MSSWLGEVYEKCHNLLPDGEVPLSVVVYGAPVALASYAGYKIWQWKSGNPQETQESKVYQEEEPVKEFSGVLKMLTTKYEPGKFKEENTIAVYIVLHGSLLEIYEAKENIPLKELYNEPEIELTFYKKTIYNINGCYIKLLPQKLDKLFRWEHFYPIEIKLCKNSLVEEIILIENPIELSEDKVDDKVNQSVILFARSDRDKEAWTRRLKTATRSKHFTPRSEDRIVSINAGKPYREKPPLYVHRKIQGLWLNSLLSRIITDEKTQELLEASITFQVQELLDNLTFGDKMETFLRLSVYKVDLQNFGSPKINGISVPYENDLGLWEEILIKYNGLLKIIIEIKLNPKIYGKEDNERPANQNYDDTPWIYRMSYLNYMYLGGVMERTRFYLEINLDLLKGGVAINIPKPPTESAWIGFREGTRLDLSGALFWGTWRLPFLYCVVNTICDQLCASFDRNFMIPNMKQLHLPMWQYN